MDTAPICFDDWEHALRTSVPADRHHAYREAIVKFRYWLRETGKLPDAATFREHLEWKKSCLAPDRFAIRREALRWYYQEGSLRMKAAGQEKVSPEPKTDQGVPCSPQEAKISVKPGSRMVGGYRTYEMNDAPRFPLHVLLSFISGLLPALRLVRRSLGEDGSLGAGGSGFAQGKLSACHP